MPPPPPRRRTLHNAIEHHRTIQNMSRTLPKIIAYFNFSLITFSSPRTVRHQDRGTPRHHCGIVILLSASLPWRNQRHEQFHLHNGVDTTHSLYDVGRRSVSRRIYYEGFKTHEIPNVCVLCVWPLSTLYMIFLSLLYLKCIIINELIIPNSVWHLTRFFFIIISHDIMTISYII